MIDLVETEDHLLRLLADAQINLSRPSVLQVWQVCKTFAEMTVDCASDALLFQSGLYDFAGRELFYLDFVRQFAIEDSEGEHDHLEQLHCEFSFEAHAGLCELETNLWSSACDSLVEFYGRVEALDEFRIPATRYLPAKLSVYQENV